MSRITSTILAAASTVVGATIATKVVAAQADAEKARSMRERAVKEATDALAKLKAESENLIGLAATLPACFRATHVQATHVQQSAQNAIGIVEAKMQTGSRQAVDTTIVSYVNDHRDKVVQMLCTIKNTLRDPHTALQSLYQENKARQDRLVDEAYRLCPPPCSPEALDALNACATIAWQEDTVKVCVERRFLEQGMLEMETWQSQLNVLDAMLHKLQEK